MRRVVLIQPQRDGRIMGKSPGSPYTLMRLASLVPNEIPVEIWDENLMTLPLDTLGEGDLVGITSMTVTIDGAETIAKRAMKRGAGVVMGGVHATLMPFCDGGRRVLHLAEACAGLCGRGHQGHAAHLCR
jgi:hypothetical protein